MKDKERDIADIRGSWLNNLIIGDEEIWNIDLHRPSRQKYANNPILSDMRFREDFLWIFHKQNKYAEEWKLALEEV